MRRLLFILCLLPMLAFSQALQRQFFTTNTAPNVAVVAGTNAFITFSLVGQQRTYRVDTPASGTATNIVWPVQGTNVFLTTNGLAIVIDVPSPLIPWQAITNITSIQIPAAAVTNAPWSTTGQTNLALTIAGTNVFVHSVTNLGVTTYTIDVPLQPQQTNWSLSSITNANYLTNWATINTNLLNDLDQTNWPWQSITNIATVQIPYAAITNPPAAGGQTNLALVVSGTNVFVSSVTNLGVTTFTIDVPASGSGQTNLALVVSGTNAFVTATTNLGVTTYTIDGPPIRVQWSVGDITNAGTLAYSNVSVLIGATNTATLTTQLGLSSYTNTATLTTQLGLGTAAYSNTAAFLLKSGDTSTGPQLTTSASTNAPAGNEFVTGSWVRGLINQGFFEYASTNIISGTNADSPNQFLYEFHMQHIPDSAVRVWPNTFLTNGGYVGSVSTTNTFQSIAGQILVNAYIGLSSGGGDALSLKPEIYLSTDRSNWYGDFDCSAQAITPGITQLYSFVVSFPAQTATNPAGFYIERRLKVVSKGGSPTMYFLVGTNAISGTNSASHISINAAPVQGGTFSGVFIGNGYGLTNIPQSAITNASGISSTNSPTTNSILYSTDGTNYANLPQLPQAANLGSRPLVPFTQGSALHYGAVSQLGKRRLYLWHQTASATPAAIGDTVANGVAPNKVIATATAPSYLYFKTLATTADTNYINSSSQMHPTSRSGVFTFSATITNATNFRAWVGLASVDAGTLAASETNSARTVVAFLGSSTNWANWQFVTDDGNAAHWTFTDTGVATSTSVTNFTIYFNANGSVLTSCVGELNGILVATNSANLPSAALRTQIAFATLANAVAGLNFYWAEFEQDD